MHTATSESVLEDAPLNSFHKKLALYSAGGPFLDGYILSIIGIALVQAGPQLNLTSFWEGLIGASALVGVFFGGFLGGWFTDKYGRQMLYTIDLVAIIVLSVAQFWVTDAMWLFILRLLIGVAVGADYPIATSLLTEFTPKRYRGPLVGGLIAMWFVGAAVAYVVGEMLLHTGPDGWRWMLASSALPALVFVVMRHGTPESPRWLIHKGRAEEAKAVLKQISGKDIPLSSLEKKTTEKHIGVGGLFKSGYGARLAFVTIFWTASTVPLFAIYAFGPKILGALGLGGESNFGAALITILFLVGSVASLFFVNRIGRRPLILHSFFWSAVPLLLLGLFPNVSSTITLLLFSAYALFIGGTQILQWVYPNELFPTQIRATAVGLAASLSRIGAAVGTYLVPVALESIGIGNTMVIAAAITIFGFFICLKMAPETNNVSLDAAGDV